MTNPIRCAPERIAEIRRLMNSGFLRNALIEVGDLLGHVAALDAEIATKNVLLAERRNAQERTRAACKAFAIPDDQGRVSDDPVEVCGALREAYDRRGEEIARLRAAILATACKYWCMHEEYCTAKKIAEMVPTGGRHD